MYDNVSINETNEGLGKYKNNAKAKGFREIPKSCIFLSMRVGCGSGGWGS